IRGLLTGDDDGWGQGQAGQLGRAPAHAGRPATTTEFWPERANNDLLAGRSERRSIPSMDRAMLAAAFRACRTDSVIGGWDPSACSESVRGRSYCWTDRPNFLADRQATARSHRARIASGCPGPSRHSRSATMRSYRESASFGFFASRYAEARLARALTVSR